MRGNFGIRDEKGYMAFVLHKEDDESLQTYFSNSKPLAEKQMQLFEELWSMAIPFSTRMKELEYEVNRDTQKTISDFENIQGEVESLLLTCKKDLTIFSSTILFRRLLVSNNIKEILKKLLKKGVKIKILLDNVLGDFMHQINQINNENPDNDLLQVSYSSKLGNFNEFIIICDQKSVLQINSDATSNLKGSLSNEQHQVILQEVLFEKYWNEVIDITISK